MSIPPGQPEIKMMFSPKEEAFERKRKAAGFFLTPLLFLLVYFWPMPSLKPEAHTLAAILIAIIVLWVTEAVPIPVAAFLAPTLAVLLGVAPAKEAYAPLADPTIMLFMGGFIIAASMTKHGLDRRFALGILSIRAVGRTPATVLFGFAAIAFILSMWISNSATTAMMYPIALGILGTMAGMQAAGDQGFGKYPTGLLLGGAAYASSIGGMATPVGTPPNLIAIGMLEKAINFRISFFNWMLFALPVALVMLLIAYFYIRRVCPAPLKDISGGREFIRGERQRLGGWTVGQRNTLIAFLTTVALWVVPGILALVLNPKSPVLAFAKNNMQEGAMALLGASILFFLPLDWKEKKFTMTFDDAKKIDWGTLLLFGGGLALGGMMFKTGLAEAMGKGFLALFPIHDPWVLTFFVIPFTIFFTEVTSNTAATNMLVPIIIGICAAMGVSPIGPAVACALAASCAFMLPVATPPNAIVYGSGLVPITQMIKIGFWMNLMGTVAIWVVLRLVLPALGLM